MHIPINFNLIYKKNGFYLNSTFGYNKFFSKLIVKNMFIFDKDYISIYFAKKKYYNQNKILIFNISFSKIIDIFLICNTIGKMDYILSDLGYSLYQIKKNFRGFSFSYNEFLDMRLNINQNVNIINWINNASKLDMKYVFFKYINCNIRIINKLINNIFVYKKKKNIDTTKQFIFLVNKTCLSKYLAVKIFKILELFINNELFELNLFLNRIIDTSSINSKLIIISFNLLENKIIKKNLFINKKNISIFKYIKLNNYEQKLNYCSKYSVIRIIKKIN